MASLFRVYLPDKPRNNAYHDTFTVLSPGLSKPLKLPQFVDVRSDSQCLQTTEVFEGVALQTADLVVVEGQEA